MKDITDLFQELLHNNRSVDIAEAEFKKLIHEDAELHEQYRDWCDAVGSSEKMGFLDYCDLSETELFCVPICNLRP